MIATVFMTALLMFPKHIYSDLKLLFLLVGSLVSSHIHLYIAGTDFVTFYYKTKSQVNKVITLMQHQYLQ